MADSSFEVIEEVVAPSVPAPIAGTLAPGPYNFEFTGEDALRLTVLNSLVGVVVGVSWRSYTPGNRTRPSREVHVPTSDRLVSTKEFAIGEGFLLNATLSATSGSPKRGQTWAKLEVIRGLGAAAIVLGTIAAGHITATIPLAWPGSPIENSTDGDGYLRLITGTQPAAGLEVNERVPVGARWELLTFRTNLVAGGTVANRRSGLSVLGSGPAFFRSPQPKDHAASTQMDNYWSQGMPFATSILSDVSIAGLPTGFKLGPDTTIVTATNNLQAADQYSAPLYSVREWLEI